jgi:hypothetical protein
MWTDHNRLLNDLIELVHFQSPSHCNEEMQLMIMHYSGEKEVEIFPLQMGIDQIYSHGSNLLGG